MSLADSAWPIPYDAPASVMHFLVKLVSAAPCSFCAAAWSLQHFLAKLFKAAPCRLLPVAWTAQLSSAAAAVTMQNDATMMASVFMFFSLVVARKTGTLEHDPEKACPRT